MSLRSFVKPMSIVWNCAKTTPSLAVENFYCIYSKLKHLGSKLMCSIKENLEHGNSILFYFFHLDKCSRRLLHSHRFVCQFRLPNDINWLFLSVELKRNFKSLNIGLFSYIVICLDVIRSNHMTFLKCLANYLLLCSQPNRKWE